MADLISQDVVNSVRSADASASVDVSASTINGPVAIAANSSAHNVDEPATAASLLDRNIAAATQLTENDLSSRGGHISDQEHSKAQSFEKHIEDGTHEGSMHGGSDAGTRSATGSAGHSAISDGDFVQSETPEGGSKHGDATPRSTMKKPSGFKAVSVTKNFLAKAGTPVLQLPKPGPETSTSLATPTSSFTSNTARPRLVAKSGSGHKLSMSTQISNSSKLGHTSGPDPMQVWNRNRVQTPQATPKHLTNEELREQYGIQLASIPIGDGDDKGNKWADIDDEEDDWAPEVIEWSDGSKVNLADAEKAAAEKAKAAAEVTKHDETARIPVSTTKSTSSLGPKATVLKVGIAAQTKAAGDTGASGKTTDKPTLVAKPVPPTLVKSPWATLPPVDKVSPVPVHVPVPAGPPTLQRQQASESQSGERGSMPWRHAKEIEADDFSRIPRDAPNGIPRELFNSQSGKYEPVTEGRRGSVKRDQNFRPPSVLQRPGPEPDVSISNPHRQHAEDDSEQPSTERRSSTTELVTDFQQSGEPAQPWRRRTGSWVSNHTQNGPQSLQGQTSAQSQGSQVEASSQAHIQAPTAADQPPEDPVAVQKRLMREKREAAIKRRQEEEAKEEAERRERIKKKLEAMGPPPEKKDKEKLSTASSSPAISSAALPTKSSDESKINSDSKDEVSRSPPKPPIPATAGPPQQYGMIKVHPSPLVNGVGVQTASMMAGMSSNSTESQRPSKSELVARSASSTAASDHKANSKTLLDPAYNESVSTEKSRWGYNINQASKAWERSGDVQNVVHTNLWASGSHRNLGNGDFNGLNAQTRSQFRQPQISPDSILPSPQSVAPPSLFHDEKNAATAAVALHAVGSSPKPSPDAGPVGRAAQSSSDVAAHGTLPQPPSTQSRSSGLPSPLSHSHPAKPNMPLPSKHFSTLPEPRTGVDSWASFTSNVGDHDLASRARIIQERTRHAPEAPAHQQKSSSRQYNETWKQVTRGEDLGSRHVVNTQIATRTQSQTPVVGAIMEENVRQSPVIMPPQQPRPSKFYSFFGQQEHAPHMVLRQHTTNRVVSPPLPPSDSILHPVFDGESLRPRVRFPGHEREDLPLRPVVKLPPPKPMPQHPVVAELRGMPPPLRGPAQPLAKTLSWQNRFDGLFNKAPDRKILEPIEFSSSKAQFDILSSNGSAAVNFPQPGQISPVSPRFSTSYVEGGITADEEEALFDGEQDPGSTPPVRVPANKFPANWRPASLPNGKRTQLSDQHISSRSIWIVGLEDFQGKKVTITARLPNMGLPKRVEMVTNYLRNPKFLNKLTLSQNGKSISKTLRKPREPISRQVAQQGQPLHQAHQVNSASKPTAASSIPTTWAKRVSAGI